MKDHAAQRCAHVIRRHAVVKRRDDLRVLPAGHDVSRQAMRHGVQPVCDHQAAVKFALDLRVADPALPYFLIDIGVAAHIQRKVAQHAVDVGQLRLAALPQNSRGAEKKVSARPLVRLEPHRTDRVGLQGVVVKQDVRPVQTDVIKRTEDVDHRPAFWQQFFVNLLPETKMCVGGWHPRWPPLSPKSLGVYRACVKIFSGLRKITLTLPFASLL